MPVPPPACYWEHFEHHADIGVRGIGRTLEQAFEQAALALTAVLLDPCQIPAQQARPLVCQADAREQLFIDWLNSVIYAMAVAEMLFGHFQVTIEGHNLQGLARGELISRLPPSARGLEVKAATYAELKVVQESPQRWLAQCVVDV